MMCKPFFLLHEKVRFITLKMQAGGADTQKSISEATRLLDSQESMNFFNENECCYLVHKNK